MPTEMTMRDHFAAAALTGLLAQGDDGSFSEESYVLAAYRWADAMLRERGNQPEPPDSSMPDADSRVWDTQGHRQPTLTDEEREAVADAADRYAALAPESAETVATLRGLLDRTQTVRK